MATKRKKVKKAGTKTSASNGRHVAIRMYNVGFGDAFLVTIFDGAERRRILFDCGSVEAAPDLPMKQIVNRIIGDVTDGGVAHIDVVVATHRHKDHVSGFAHAGWTNVEVGEVWMPWTEDPKDDEARRIRNTQSRLALGLQTALAARPAGAVDQETLTRAQGILENALMLSNDDAMKTLHAGFVGDPQRRFLPTKGGESRTFETDALPGVKVHVLGPSRSRNVIRDMDPPKGESFMRLNAALDSQTGTPPAPFDSEFRRDEYEGNEPLEAADLVEIQRAGSISDLAVAVALDKAVNGTSLMLILEISGTYLLFPGDAQWGTWQAAMEDPEWRELLKRVSFYKVGHHGSHNATPKDFVTTLIPDGMCAMASTLTRDIWPDIPRSPLLKGLEDRKAVIARSDRAKKAPKPYRVDGDVIELRIAL
jgi:beta-lactamase superfamily II metal-dependent hydrolase